MVVKLRKGDFTGPSGIPIYNQNPIANPTAPTGYQFSESVTRIRYLVDEAGNLIAFPTVITDANGDIPVAVVNRNSVGPPGGLNYQSLSTLANLQLYNSATGKWDGALTGPNNNSSNTISTATTTSLIGAGGAGVKFRVWSIRVSQNAASATAGVFSIGDNSSTFNNIVPNSNPPQGTAAIQANDLYLDFRPNGLLQATANSAIECVTSSTLNCTITIQYSTG